MMSRRACGILAAVSAFALSAGQPADAQRDDDKKPSLSLRANPPVGFSPLRVRVTAELRGGADDAPDYYCPDIEWDWGDDLKSESSEDCDPYKPGATVRRRYTSEHTFQDPGGFTIRVRMKQGDRIVASASTNVQVRQGLRDDFER
jgi:hypothetical protein